MKKKIPQSEEIPEFRQSLDEMSQEDKDRVNASLKIDYNNTGALVDDIWLFLTNGKMPDKATISRKAFTHEVGAMIETVRQHILQTLSVMNPEQFHAFMVEKFKKE